jgi:hypothetical protein
MTDRESFRADLESACKGAQLGADRNRTGEAFRAASDGQNTLVCRGFYDGRMNRLDWFCVVLLTVCLNAPFVAGGVLLAGLLQGPA